MKQVYIHYQKWEDFINGMWRKLPRGEEPGMIERAIEFTGDHLRYGQAMRKVVFAWPQTMVNSLTNPSMNHRAFVGHCACQLAINCPEYITRAAWKLLTEKQRIGADQVATEAINQWRIFHYNKKQLRFAF